MLTKLIIRNFKRFEKAIIELGNPVVLIGPNNSGKTTALQALALWEIGLKRWMEKRKDQKLPKKRSGVTINRRDLIAVPVPYANLLWRALRVKSSRMLEGKQKTDSIYIDVVLEGITNGKAWECGFEFYYANEESFYCRPIRASNNNESTILEIPEAAEKIQVAFLPPMSGLSATEFKQDPGTINVLIGEGRTAEVLRNLCYRIYATSEEKWNNLKDTIKGLFGAELETPQYHPERGEIIMRYNEHGTRLDMSSSGRGLQQTLLLLSYMYANSNSVLLLDEPDAHLEILRQRELYQVLCDVAMRNGNQLIIASHSEVLLNEAADRDVVVAFVGQPHTISDHGSQVLKSLREIGWDQYYQAEQTGWVLYLEGSTDLAILKSLAERLGHAGAIEALKRPFVHYVSNNFNAIGRHFYGLKEAFPNIMCIAIVDRPEREPPAELLNIVAPWKKREIENYLCQRRVLEAYAAHIEPDQSMGPLFDGPNSNVRVSLMQQSIDEVTAALRTLGKGNPWDSNTKVSDDFLIPLFKAFFAKLQLYNIMDKSNFHELARFIKKEWIDPEVEEKLDLIAKVNQSAQLNIGGEGN